MLKSVTLSAITLFSIAINAHMIMQTPTPFNNQTLDNSPLEASGSNFPCKTNGQANFYDATGITNNMAVGEKQTLSFRGSAVHGGGSCQLAITTDKAPTASTTWQVIQTIEGGCPSKTGDGPSTYDFSIPQGVAPGKYVFAWTWISKLAGQPEYYMNCAPITVTGGSSKRRSEGSAPLKRAATLPNLAVYNLASVNSCKTSPGTDPVFPDPGSNVVKPGASPSYASPSGTNCFPMGAKGDSASSPSNASPAAGAANSASAIVSSPASVAATSAATVSSAVASGGNGSVATTFASAIATSASAVGAASSIVTSALSVVPTSTAAPSSNSSSSGSTTSSTAGGLTGACATEGMWNCLGGSSFQRCASGVWSAVMAMPGGTTCTPGQSENLFARSARHVRRHAARQRF